MQITTYNHQHIPYNLSVKLLESLQLSEDLALSTREEIFIKDIFKRVSKSKSVLYVLEDDNNIIGLIALSVTSINEQPSLQVDYILVDSNFQGQRLASLGNDKPFRYLIKLAILIGEKISLEAGLKYIVLSPDNDSLKNKYKQVGFETLNDDWMYLKL